MLLFRQGLEGSAFQGNSDYRGGCQIENHQALCSHMWPVLVYGCDESRKHDVAHEFGLNHHKFLSSWLESLTSLRNHCAHHARVWNRAYPLKPTTPQVMPNKWITNFTFREESLYAQLCCIAYWLNAINTTNTFVGDLKLLLLRNPSIDPAMMGFPSN